MIMVMISSKAIGPDRTMVPTYKSEMHEAVKEYSWAYQTNPRLTSGLQHPNYFLETAEQLHRLSQFENELLESKQKLDSRIKNNRIRLSRWLSASVRTSWTSLTSLTLRAPT